ncbi:probable flavin-containing monooxygenase 1 [Punica granatum]|uniref:Flavin-containing monooxygenase n=1 Tax=Punica granatum TaxID=22663 RepID=A0A218XGG3_PUNGR|nr:probable flavin-containing monooxygenase 1 [Punica granatum]OWM84014.1 hypothetical protein CDL15_Pgr004445 [Punica granatum]
MEGINKKNGKIGIIGAGISGLLACKYALSEGYTPLVFESQSTIGGVWTTPLETTLLQTPRELFQFSDFPWPAEVTEDFPPHYQVMGYIRSYADQFRLIEHVRFNSKVVQIEYSGAAGGEEEMEGRHYWGGSGEAFSPSAKWELTVEDTVSHATEVHEVDFVILSIGRFSDVPNFPEFQPGKGPEAFRGEVVHSMDYAAMDFGSAAAFVKGRRVTIVGFQKSALDIAAECSAANGAALPCTVVYRTEHWNVPDYMPWGVPIALLYLNRFSELLLHKPGEGPLQSLLATALYPVRLGISKFVESYIRWKHPLAKFGMVPKHNFLQQISSCLIPTVPKKFYDRVEERSIKLRKSQNIAFCSEGILLDGESSPLETDLVIFATGFRGDVKLREIFKSPRFAKCIAGQDDASVTLYRQCIHPRIPQLAILGFSESFSNLYTSEIRCRWLFELLDGTFKLPSIKEMEKDIEDWDSFMKRYSGNSYRRSCIGALHIWYNDQLCMDMGRNPRRKKGFFAELFEPYGPLDYASP